MQKKVGTNFGATKLKKTYSELNEKPFKDFSEEENEKNTLRRTVSKITRISF